MIIFLWIVCGLLAIVCFAWTNEIHKTRTISGNQLIGFVICLLFGPLSFAMFVIVIGIVYTGEWISQHGSTPIINWGKNTKNESGE